jgi:predicted DsbA family dithiol-disulfide isomerase
MPAKLKIDFVSDVSCPWCVIGLKSLEAAVTRLGGEVAVDWHFQPFELNPNMGPQGQDIVEHIVQKYGSPPEQVHRSQQMIEQRGAEVGFAFDMKQRSRIYNTFDAHRLLHWAHAEGKQKALKSALFTAYFTEGRDPSDHAVLADVAQQVGLDVQRARAILASDEYAADVRAREQFYQGHGINAVPAVIVNDRHLIEGGQPIEVFEQALRQVIAQTAQQAR